MFSQAISQDIHRLGTLGGHTDSVLCFPLPTSNLSSPGTQADATVGSPSVLWQGPHQSHLLSSLGPKQVTLEPLFSASLLAPELPTYCPLHPYCGGYIRGCISDHTLGPTTRVHCHEHQAGPCSVYTVDECHRASPFLLDLVSVTHLNSRIITSLRETRPQLFL